MWTFAQPLLALILAAATVFATYQAMRTSRTPQGAVGWVVFILTLPPIAVPIYAFFGYVNYGQFAKARRASDSALSEDATAGAPLEERSPLTVFENLGDARAEGGNGIDLLIDGEETYAALTEAIGSARRYLLLQFYTIRSDEAGRRFKAAVIERARAGVAVYILHDSFRGVGLPRRYVADLRAAGVKIRAPSGPPRVLGRLQVNFRSHRKMLVVDGQTGFTGGLNIGDEYLGRDPRIGKWRDTFVRLKGPVVSQLQRTFAADWLWTSGENIADGLEWTPNRDPRDVRGLILSPAPTDLLKTGNLYFCAMAGAARRRLWITSPYFVPDTEVMAALKLAALRGVEVRILVPDKPDHYLPWIAAFSYFDELRDAGGEIWRYTAGFLHQKVVLADDDLVSIGTINLDVRSGLLNFEQTAIFHDAASGRMVKEMLTADFARAYRMTERLDQLSPWRRIAARASRLLAPVL